MIVKDAYLEAAFAGEKRLLFDGAMGTLVQKSGLLPAGVRGDMLNLMDPKAMTAIHRLYVDAGAQVITTNTFTSNRHNLGGEVKVRDVYTAAAECARAAGALYVAADIGPIGEFLDPYGDIEPDEAYGIFAEQMEAAAAAKVDMILIETMFDCAEAEIAVRAAVDNADVPVVCTMTFNEGGRTMFGHEPASSGLALIAAGANAIGANCSVGPELLMPVAEKFLAASAEAQAQGRAGAFGCVPVLIQPNAGLPRMVDGQQVYDMDPQQFAGCMEQMVRAGVGFVGSCCGSTPEFTAAIAAMLKGLQ